LSMWPLVAMLAGVMLAALGLALLVRRQVRKEGEAHKGSDSR
jgi:hypothetical protein